MDISDDSGNTIIHFFHPHQTAADMPSLAFRGGVYLRIMNSLHKSPAPGNEQSRVSCVQSKKLRVKLMFESDHHVQLEQESLP
jgi:hypothetical protein